MHVPIKSCNLYKKSFSRTFCHFWRKKEKEEEEEGVLLSEGLKYNKKISKTAWIISRIFCNFNKFQGVSMTGKLVSKFPGCPSFPGHMGTLRMFSSLIQREELLCKH